MTPTGIAATKCQIFPPAAKYKAKVVTTNTMVVPKSFCNTAVTKLTPLTKINKGINLTLFSKRTAKYITPVNLIISAGWIVAPPIFNQRCAPPPLIPKPGMKTDTNNINEKTKAGTARGLNLL